MNQDGRFWVTIWIIVFAALLIAGLIGAGAGLYNKHLSNRTPTPSDDPYTQIIQQNENLIRKLDQAHEKFADKWTSQKCHKEIYKRDCEALQKELHNLQTILTEQIKSNNAKLTQLKKPSDPTTEGCVSPTPPPILLVIDNE